MPKRIQRKRTKGWKMPPNTVYVGRPSKWGNMYEVGKTYDIYDAEDNTLIGPCPIDTIEQSVSMFRETMEASVRLDEIDPTELRGKDLACWCSLDQPCHADVLLELANADPQP